MLGDEVDEPAVPDVTPGAAIIWQSFDELSPMRPVGFGGVERIGLPHILAYGRLFLGLGGEDLIAFARLIFALDELFIEQCRRKP